MGNPQFGLRPFKGPLSHSPRTSRGAYFLLYFNFALLGTVQRLKMPSSTVERKAAVKATAYFAAQGVQCTRRIQKEMKTRRCPVK
jgi:hypothetical protein